MYKPSTFYFDIPRPQELSRLLIFVKWILILPHVLILYLFGIAASVVGFIAWWVILFVGVYPKDMWSFVYAYMRWNARVSAYVGLFRDEYPPFGEEPYPVVFELERPQSQSRLLLFLRILTAIPLGLWLAILGVWASILWIVAWFAILVTGNIPVGIFDFLVKFTRYSLRINVYLYCLTDEWPGFSLS